ncbi:hypothetical protein [Coleofasciculus sp. FACHB-SPT9]|uniref:hypothetical protein n=1 Tax=Coleofasciculus sp. FACHB-SPT9 TaxID=2692791 RepID=UPI0016822A8E|nr:hypothetical protein [Coleofasciculus sp. FACHB-SPT9]MBD1891284.1 hypothetical protein [Coleofasciculus sp. FACHB-SPT9]
MTQWRHYLNKLLATLKKASEGFPNRHPARKNIPNISDVNYPETIQIQSLPSFTCPRSAERYVVERPLCSRMLTEGGFGDI